jgi:hypothetical protein
MRYEYSTMTLAGRENPYLVACRSKREIIRHVYGAGAGPGIITLPPRTPPPAPNFVWSMAVDSAVTWRSGEKNPRSRCRVTRRKVVRRYGAAIRGFHAPRRQICTFQWGQQALSRAPEGYTMTGILPTLYKACIGRSGAFSSLVPILASSGAFSPLSPLKHHNFARESDTVDPGMRAFPEHYNRSIHADVAATGGDRIEPRVDFESRDGRQPVPPKCRS